MFKPTNADDETILIPIDMKTFSRILAGILLLAVIYFIIVDGMVTHFGLSKAVQYAFNFGSFVVLIPFSLVALLDIDIKETES